MVLILKNTNINYKIATIDEDAEKIKIHHSDLKKLMKTNGIDIPAFLQAAYDNQKTVRLGEKNFIRAFKQIYWQNNMDPEVYKWFKPKKQSAA
jgi:hypothetical protein